MILPRSSIGRISTILPSLTVLAGIVAAVAGVTQGTFTAQTGSQGASCVNGRVTCPSGYSIQCRYGGSPYCQGTAPRCQPGPENVINDAYCVSSGGTAGGGTPGGGATTGGTAGGGTTTGGGTAAGGTAGGGGPGPNTPRASCTPQGLLTCSSGIAACANGESPTCQNCGGTMTAACGSCGQPAYCCGVSMCPIGGGGGVPPGCQIFQPPPNFSPNGSCTLPCPSMVCSGGSSAGGGQSSSDIGFCGPECGDRIVMAPEECDNGTRNSDTAPDACRTDCTKAHCGDGVEDANEGCDDGGTEDGDGCSASCEEEDDESSSSASSTEPVCGNAKRESGEECDDGNTNNDDCCDSSCQIEEGCVCDEGAASAAQTSASGGASSADGTGTPYCCRVTPAPMQCQPFIANFCGFGTAYDYVEFDSLSTCEDRCKYTCSDSEGGVNISVAGTLTVTGPYGTNEHADTCFSATKVSECFCETVAGVGQWNKCELRDCPQGTTCQNGACVGGGGSCPWPLTPTSSLSCPPAAFPDQTEFDCPRQGCCRCMPPAVTSATCTDTDGGYNYTVAGSATQGSPYPSYTGIDRCDGNTVVEFFCGASGGVVQTGIPCNNVRDDALCVNGACQ